MVENKVLVGCPTSVRHKYVLKRHWDSVKNLDADFYYLDTTPSDVIDQEFISLISEIKQHPRAKVDKFSFKLAEKSVHQWLADARNKIREHFLANQQYTHLFFVDSDIILPSGIQVLLDADKDQIGYPYPLFAKNKGSYHPPNAMKHGYVILKPGNPKNGLYDFYDWEELNKMPCPAKVYACGMGCLLIKRKVLEKVPFRTHPSFVVGEDIWFHIEAADKGFEAWCYQSILPEHDNTSWDEVEKPFHKGDIMDIMLLPKTVIANPSDLPGSFGGMCDG